MEEGKITEGELLNTQIECCGAAILWGGSFGKSTTSDLIGAWSLLHEEGHSEQVTTAALLTFTGRFAEESLLEMKVDSWLSTISVAGLHGSDDVPKWQASQPSFASVFDSIDHTEDNDTWLSLAQQFFRAVFTDGWFSMLSKAPADETEKQRLLDVCQAFLNDCEKSTPSGFGDSETDDLWDTRLAHLQIPVVRAFRAIVSLLVAEPFSNGCSPEDVDYVMESKGKSGKPTMTECALVPTAISKTLIRTLQRAYGPLISTYTRHVGAESTFGVALTEMLEKAEAVSSDKEADSDSEATTKMDLLKKWAASGAATKKALRKGAAARLEGIFMTWAEALAEKAAAKAAAVPLADLKILSDVVNTFEEDMAGSQDIRQTYHDLLQERVEADAIESLEESVNKNIGSIAEVQALLTAVKACAMLEKRPQLIEKTDECFDLAVSFLVRHIKTEVESEEEMDLSGVDVICQLLEEISAEKTSPSPSTSVQQSTAQLLKARALAAARMFGDAKQMEGHQQKTGDGSGGAFLEELLQSSLTCSSLIETPHIGVSQVGAHWAGQLDDFTRERLAEDIKGRVDRAVARRASDSVSALGEATVALRMVAAGGKVVNGQAEAWHKDFELDKDKDTKPQIMQCFLATVDKADLAAIENATTAGLKAPACK